MSRGQYQRDDLIDRFRSHFEEVEEELPSKDIKFGLSYGSPDNDASVEANIRNPVTGEDVSGEKGTLPILIEDEKSRYAIFPYVEDSKDTIYRSKKDKAEERMLKAYNFFKDYDSQEFEAAAIFFDEPYGKVHESFSLEDALEERA